MQKQGSGLEEVDGMTLKGKQLFLHDTKMQNLCSGSVVYDGQAHATVPVLGCMCL